MRATLRSLAGYGGVMFDLDGTLYRGAAALPGAGDFVRACRDAGLRIAFGTNNALLERDTIASRLQGMGIDAAPSELVTAPDSLAAVVHAAGHETVALLGSVGLRESLERVGIQAPDVDDVRPGDATAVAVGLDPDRSLAGVARAAALVRDGAPLFATAADPQYPTDRGIEAGTGAMLAALHAMVAVDPELCGKPSRHFGERTATQVDTGRPVLVVGDSLAADVGVATTMGWDSLLLLTGSTRATDVDATGPPTYVQSDLVAVLGDLQG